MRIRNALESLKPYAPPKLAEEAEAEQRLNGYAKLTSNELSFGPLPEAEAAVREVIPRSNRYPDRQASALRRKITEVNPPVSTQNVVVGNGSSEVLLNLLQLLHRPGEVIFPWPTFTLYNLICTTLGLTPRTVPLTEDHRAKPEALLSTVTEETRAVILCNPNNPSGTHLTMEEIEDFARELPEGVLLILDEAYQEFVSDPAYHGSHTLALDLPNVAVVRTFSKAHGLAGLRMGYGIAPARVSDYAERIRFPFSVNLAAQAAATASMQQREKIEERARFIIGERERLQRAFGEAGLEYIPSQGNFIMVRTGTEVFERNGVLVREGEALGYPEGWSRVTVGGSEENDRVVGALSQ